MWLGSEGDFKKSVQGMIKSKPNECEMTTTIPTKNQDKNAQNEMSVDAPGDTI